MLSCDWNAFHITVYLQGGPSVNSGFPLQKASDAELDIFFGISTNNLLNKQSSASPKIHDIHVTSLMLYKLIMGCHTVSTVPIWVRIPGPQTWIWGEASWWDPGIHTNTVGRWHSFWQTIFNLYYCTGSLKLFCYPLSGIQCQRESLSSGWIWRHVIRSPAHRHYHSNFQYFCIQWH